MNICRNSNSVRNVLYLTLPLLIAVIISVIGISISDGTDAETFEGSCGETVTWELDSDSETLTLTGNGSTKSYNDSGYQDWNCYPYKHVVINEGITGIGNHLFMFNHDITDVKLPNSLEIIGDGAFSDCISLKTIQIDNNNISIIGNNAFENCISLEDTLIHSDLDSLGICAYKTCRQITSVTIPAAFTEIPSNCFEECNRLSTVYFEDSSVLGSIGDCAFCNCGSLHTLSLPKSINSIGNSAFKGSGLQNLDLTEYDNLTIIGEEAFSRSDIQSFVSSRNIENLGRDAFIFCDELVSLDLKNSEKLSTIETQMCYFCGKLSNVTIADNVKTIGY